MRPSISPTPTVRPSTPPTAGTDSSTPAGTAAGYCVKIDHGNGFITWYGHNSDLYVSVGDHVYKGQTIAAMGSTGISAAPTATSVSARNGTMVDPPELSALMKMIHEKLPGSCRGGFLLPGSGAGSCSGIVENPKFSQGVSQRPQHYAIHHAGQCAVDDHRAGNDEHFGRHAGDEALSLEIQRRGRHGVGKARDGYQRPAPPNRASRW